MVFLAVPPAIDAFCQHLRREPTIKADISLVMASGVALFAKRATMRELPAQAGLLRSINRSTIIDFVRRKQMTSPSRVSIGLGISLPTVTRVLEGLREEGL